MTHPGKILCRSLTIVIIVFAAFPRASANDNNSLIESTSPTATTTIGYFHNELASSGDTTGTIDISWTAPGDDDTIGTAAYYMIRYSQDPISDATWDSASQVQSPPPPLPAGTWQSFTLTGLDCGGYYYAAIKTSDEAGNISLLSNIAENYASGIPTPTPAGASYDSALNIITVYASLVSFHLPIYYEFALDTTRLFSNPIIGLDLIVDTLASAAFGELQENLFYFWRVRAVASDRSDSSHWSSADSFYIYEADNISPVVVVIAPNGGEQWHSGSVEDITWSASDNEGIAAYRIDYSTDAGVNWLAIAEWTGGNPETYSWAIPDISSDQCLVKVSCRDFTGNTAFDSSDAMFLISNNLPLSVTVVSPNGRERWDEMSLQTITWSDSSSQMESFRIEYSVNGGDNWVPVCDWTTGDPQQYDWQLPPTPSRRTRVRISCRDQQGNEATDNVGVDSFMIEYTTDGGTSWVTVSEWASGNPGSFKWRVPNTLAGQCLLRTSCIDADGNAASDTSDNPFFIQDTFRPLVTIMSPTPDDSLESDSLVISWLAHDNGTIIGFALGYSADDGVTWNEIAHGNGGDSGYVNWEIPPGFNYLGLRVACIDEALNIGEDTVYFYPTAIDNNVSQTPSEFSLSQAYPNPFNPATTITYALAEPSFVLLEVYDLLGCRVAVLVNKIQETGYYQAVWNAQKLSSGTYIYRLKAGGYNEVKKMMLLK